MGQPDMLGHLSHVQNISKPCRPLILSENGFPIWILMTLKKLASTIPEPIINQQVFSSSHCSVGGFPPNVELPSNHHPWWSLKFGKLKPWLGDSPCYITPGKFGGDFAAHSMTPSPTPSPIRWKASPNNELRWFFHNPAARWAAGEERFLAMERWGMDLWWGKMRLQLLIKHDKPWDFEEFQRFSILFFILGVEHLYHSFRQRMAGSLALTGACCSMRSEDGHGTRVSHHILASIGSKISWGNTHNWLVVWTPLKNISQLGWLFPIYGKIKNVPNHQPDNYSEGSNSRNLYPMDIVT